MDDNQEQEGPLIPENTKRASMALMWLLFYSFLMFTMPFASYFGTQYVLKTYFDCADFTVIGFSVLAVVITVNGIIMCYAYKAYHETEYDDEGNVIKFDEMDKTDLNLKED